MRCPRRQILESSSSTNIQLGLCAAPSRCFTVSENGASTVLKPRNNAVYHVSVSGLHLPCNARPFSCKDAVFYRIRPFMRHPAIPVPPMPMPMYQGLQSYNAPSLLAAFHCCPHHHHKHNYHSPWRPAQKLISCCIAAAAHHHDATEAPSQRFNRISKKSFVNSQLEELVAWCYKSSSHSLRENQDLYAY